MTVDLDGGAPRTGRRRIDWRKAAELVAEGAPPGAIIGQVGCSRRQLSRRLNHDTVFQGWVEELRQAAIERERSRISELGRAVQTAIEVEVKKGNVRVLLWLADRLKLITPPSEGTPDQELREILRGLSSDELREFESLQDEG
jgi:hypothetical protein